MQIGIFYFTGTGNTEFIARELKAAFEPKHPTELFNIEFLPGHLKPEQFQHFDVLVFGAPVLAFNAPKFFAKFLCRLPGGTGKRTFLFLNSGGEALAGLAYPRSILRRKGYAIANEAIFVTPGNMILTEKNEETGELVFKFFGIIYKENTKAMFEDCRIQVKEIAGQILNGESSPVRIIPGQRLVSGPLRLIFFHLACNFFKWQVYVTKTCNLCAICAQTCPTGNITIKGKKVKFGSTCTVCYRCFNNCPKMAIQLRWPLGSLGNKVPYRAPGFKTPIHKR
jgi:ferredoxin